SPPCLRVSLSDAFVIVSLTFSFFFNHTATTLIYTLSLHDALPISSYRRVAIPADRLLRIVEDAAADPGARASAAVALGPTLDAGDRKSTRLNSSHQFISYAVFCLKQKSLSSD